MSCLSAIGLHFYDYMTIEKKFPDLTIWRNHKHYYNLELPQRCPKCQAVIIRKSEKETPSPAITFGTIRSTFEISRNGHERPRRDIVIKVELDSGVEVNVLYSGIENNIEANCRVKIEDVRVKNGIQKVVTILKKIENKIIQPISSDPEKVPEASKFSK